MAHSKLEKLFNLLEKWKSHNEIHAKPSDGILYELFKELLNSLDEPEQEAPAPPQTPPPIMAANDDPPGGNNPGTPDIP